MFDLGWTELLLIGVVALIVVGPKDLPGMFRALGRFTARMRSMAREFQRAMDQAADEAGVKDISRDIKKVASPRQMGIDSVKSLAADIKNDLNPIGPSNISPASSGQDTTLDAREEADGTGAVASKETPAPAANASELESGEPAASEAQDQSLKAPDAGEGASARQ